MLPSEYLLWNPSAGTKLPFEYMLGNPWAGTKPPFGFIFVSAGHTKSATTIWESENIATPFQGLSGAKLSFKGSWKSILWNKHWESIFLGCVLGGRQRSSNIAGLVSFPVEETSAAFTPMQCSGLNVFSRHKLPFGYIPGKSHRNEISPAWP